VDRATLVRALAEEGVEGARALLRRAAGEDALLAQRIAALREQLRRQVARRVGRRIAEYDRRAEELERVRVSDEALLREELARLEERLRAAREIDLSRIVDPGLLDDVWAALLVPDASWNRPPPPAGLISRLRAFLRRILEFFRRLFGRRRAPGPATEGRPLLLARLAGSGRTLDAGAIGEALRALAPAQREELRERVDERVRRASSQLERTAEEKRREAEAQRRRLEAEREEARRRAESESDRVVKEAEERRVTDELRERGLVADRDGELAVTYALIERFARLVLEDETHRLPGEVRRSLAGSGATGIYEKARLRQPDEIAHLDIPSSLLAARLEGSRHLIEATSYVYREILSERVHIVLALDKSGSMAEGQKLLAAKKSLLALYTAIRRRYPDATIDVIAFDNDVHVLDLLELWETPPGAFTNTGEALHVGHLLLRPSRASRREMFLITDGLPESYTDRDGQVRSGNLDAAMEYALARAEELRTIGPLRFSMVLLRSDHPEYERAARLLTRQLQGELIVTDPSHLGVELLVRWAGGTETVRAPPPGGAPAGAPSAAPPPAPSPPGVGRGRGRRRRTDRRMGG
jgi:Mg-chelatase subunit ChlD